MGQFWNESTLGTTIEGVPSSTRRERQVHDQMNASGRTIRMLPE
jgi:hypothetical protein